MDLRKPFFNIIEKLAEQDDSIHVLTADLGYSFCEGLAERRPQQFTNVGIMENHMVGLAAGMAIKGKKPFCYTGAVFYLRAYEFIRDDVCYNNLDVKLIGTGAADFLGFTHNFQGEENTVELYKNFPNFLRLAPSDEGELEEAINYKGACYIEL